MFALPSPQIAEQERTALCAFINGRRQLSGRNPILTASNITDVDVYWDNGENPDPTYPRDDRPPTFEVRVTYWDPDTRASVTTNIPPDWMLTRLYAALLGLAVH
jgi:hypothetical protein